MLTAIVRVIHYGPRGEVNGAILEDQSIIRIPPHTANQIGSLLQVGQPISVVRYGAENEYGRVIEATSIGSPGKPMILVTDPGPGGRRWRFTLAVAYEPRLVWKNIGRFPAGSTF